MTDALNPNHVLWTRMEDGPPPRPTTPYQPYLVWAHSPVGPASSGVCLVVQWERDAMRWNPHALLSLGGDYLVVTHWAPCPRPEGLGR